MKPSSTAKASTDSAQESARIIQEQAVDGGNDEAASPAAAATEDDDDDSDGGSFDATVVMVVVGDLDSGEVEMSAVAGGGAGRAAGSGSTIES